ncbi:MAG: thioesterase family protein [Flavobacteriales bacterium]
MPTDTEIFTSKVALRWADIDANFHVRHTVFYDLGSEQRIRLLGELGAPLSDMQLNGYGPVLFREECRFLKEVKLEDSVQITVSIRGLSKDHRKFGWRHVLERNGETCAIVEVDGAWFDSRTRKVFVPPQQVVDAMDRFPRSEDFVWI